MTVTKSDIVGRYNFNKASGAPILITPEVSKLLRGLLRMTLQRAADASSIKRTQLLHFENDNRPLSKRSKRWLQSMFESAGAEFFVGQGKLYVSLNGQSVISFGDKAEELKELPLGDDSRILRYDAGLSQNELALISGVPQCRISAIENNRPRKFYLADQVAIKQALTANFD